MATTMIPPTETPRSGASPAVRFVTVRADLLPEEVIAARQALVVRKKVIVALVALVALIAGWYALSWWQTSSARGDLDEMQQRNAALTSQQNEFRSLFEAQSGAQRIQSQLRTVMVGDLSWNDLLARVRAAAPDGVTLTNIGATVSATPTGVGGVPAGLNSSGRPQIGTLTLTGTARDKNSVAAYADKLAKLTGLTAPLISSVTTAEHVVTFSINALMTADALGGRYATAPASTDGGH